MLAVSQKKKLRLQNKYRPGCTWTLNACPEILFFKKDSMNKRHMNRYTLIWVSPLFENQGRMHKQWGLISLYICIMLPIFWKRNLTKLLLIKSICPMWMNPRLKRNVRLLKCYRMVHYRMWNQHRKQLSLGKLGYTIFCVCYEIYIHSGAELPRIYS